MTELRFRFFDQSKSPADNIWTRQNTDKNRWKNRRKTQAPPTNPTPVVQIVTGFRI